MTSRRPLVRAPLLAALAVVVLAALVGPPAVSVEKNGFDLTDARIPPDEVFIGTGRDSIPAIDDPRFVPADEARVLEPRDRVLGFDDSGRPRAYPLAILDRHEVVNDTTGPVPVAITWCPLCGSGVAFDARADGRTLRFGVSGLLYNSDVLLYDRETESLWSQLLGEAVSGPAAGARLEMLPVTHTTWEDWRERHPDSLVLSRATGFARRYGERAYAGYRDVPTPMFPVAHESDRYPAKSWVVGVVVDGVAKAYPFAELGEGEGVVEDEVAGRALRIRHDAEHRTATVLDEDGEELPAVVAYWFAWYAFHPDGEVYTAGGR